VAKEDPDIITTNGGDSFDFPYLYHRAGKYGIPLNLGARKTKTRKKGSLISAMAGYSINQKAYPFSRLHLDRASFMFKAGGLPGLIDLSRITGYPCRNSRA